MEKIFVYTSLFLQLDEYPEGREGSLWIRAGRSAMETRKIRSHKVHLWKRKQLNEITGAWAAGVREGLNNGGSLEPLEGTPGDSKVAELYIFLPTAFLPFPIPSIHFFPPWRHACLIPDPFITRRKRPPTEVSSHRCPRTWRCPFLSFFLSSSFFVSRPKLR